MKTKLTNGDTIETYTDETGTYSAKWQIGDKTGDCYQKGDEVTNELENTETTKEAAISRLEKAGYNAETVPGGVVVKGEDWEAFFADSGQDGNTYSGNVPSEVEALAVWDDTTTRTA
jgi:biotin operon repressor